MKKIIVTLLCLALALGCAASLAENNTDTVLGTIDVNGAFELRCAVPEGYTIKEAEQLFDNGILSREISSDDPARPVMRLSIAFEELLSEVDRLNDLDDEALKSIEATFDDEGEIQISYTETAQGTKLMMVSASGEDMNFVDFYTIYKGYEIEFLMFPGEGANEVLTEEQTQLAVDFLSSLEFVEI